MAVGGEIHLRRAFKIQQGCNAFDLGKAGFFHALELEPGMENASAECGMQFPEDLHGEFFLEGDR